MDNDAAGNSRPSRSYVLFRLAKPPPFTDFAVKCVSHVLEAVRASEECSTSAFGGFGRSPRAVGGRR